MRRIWLAEMPMGDPFGGVPYGEYNDPMTAMAVGGAGASIGSGLFGKSSANKAAKIQEGAAAQASDRLGAATGAANGVLGDAYRSQSNYLYPWLTAGGNALNQLQYGLGQDSTTYDPNAQLGPRKTADDYHAELVGKFTTPGAKNKYGTLKENAHDTIDEAGLKAAIDQAMAADDTKYQAAAAANQQYQGTGEKGGLLRNFGMSDFQADPGYQFALDQGQRGIQNSAAAGGGLLSGATLKALTRFNQNTANNQYQASYDRYNQNQQNQLNTLFNASGIGQQSAGAIGGYGMNYGNSVAGNLMNLGGSQAGLTQQQGEARAGGVMGGANAISQGIGGALNSLGSFQMMGALSKMNRQTGYGSQPVQYIQQGQG